MPSLFYSVHLHPYFVCACSKALAKLQGRGGSSEPSVVTYAVEIQTYFFNTLKDELTTQLKNILYTHVIFMSILSLHLPIMYIFFFVQFTQVYTFKCQNKKITSVKGSILTKLIGYLKSMVLIICTKNESNLTNRY